MESSVIIAVHCTSTTEKLNQHSPSTNSIGIQSCKIVFCSVSSSIPQFGFSMQSRSYVYRSAGRGIKIWKFDFFTACCSLTLYLMKPWSVKLTFSELFIFPRQHTTLYFFVVKVTGDGFFKYFTKCWFHIRGKYPFWLHNVSSFKLLVRFASSRMNYI